MTNTNPTPTLDARYNDTAILDAMTRLIVINPSQGRRLIEFANLGFFIDATEVLCTIEQAIRETEAAAQDAARNLTNVEIALRRDNILAAIPTADVEHREELAASAARMTAELNRRAAPDTPAPAEIAYRIPGKGNFKRRTFKTEAAAEAFLDALREREGDDIEVRWAS